MLRRRVGRGIVALAMGVLAALALGGAPALADEWGSGPKTVTVTAATFKEDIESIAGDGAVVIDAYRIATATRSDDSVAYEYDLVAPFDTEALKSALESGDYETLANGAAKLVGSASGDVCSGSLNEAIDLSGSDDGDGVWLLMPHGGNKAADSLAASSAKYDYTFKPIVVTLPTKDRVDEDGSLNSANGEWVCDAVVDLKVARDESVTPPPPSKKKRVPKTGEETNLMPFYAAMGVSGGLLALMAVQGVLRRRREGSE